MVSQVQVILVEVAAVAEAKVQAPKLVVVAVPV
jgi:hypothetical protein